VLNSPHLVIFISVYPLPPLPPRLLLLAEEDLLLELLVEEDLLELLEGLLDLVFELLELDLVELLEGLLDLVLELLELDLVELLEGLLDLVFDLLDEDLVLELLEGLLLLVEDLLLLLIPELDDLELLFGAMALLFCLLLGLVVLVSLDEDPRLEIDSLSLRLALGRSLLVAPTLEGVLLSGLSILRSTDCLSETLGLLDLGLSFAAILPDLDTALSLSIVLMPSVLLLVFPGFLTIPLVEAEVDPPYRDP